MKKDNGMKTTLLVAAIAAGLTLAAGAQARTGHADRGFGMDMPSFAELDADSDGAVTPAEIAAARDARADARFTQADADGDGALSAAELASRAEVDRRAEQAARIAAQIARRDTNGDGLLQADELAAQPEGRGPRSARMFERMDANEDGSLSAAEFAEAQARMQDRGAHGPHGH